MVVYLDTKDEVSIGSKNFPSHRLLGISRRRDKWDSARRSALHCQPAVGGFGFAALLFVSVLQRDELRSQRQCVEMTWPRQHSCQHAVIIFGLLAFLPMFLSRYRHWGQYTLRELWNSLPPNVTRGMSVECLMLFDTIQCNVKTRYTTVQSIRSDWLRLASQARWIDWD